MTATLTDTDASPHLVVLSGFHAGARCRLPSGTCSIGSDASDAVILGDPGVFPGHLFLDVQGASATLRTAHGGVALDGVDLLPGDGVAVALPFDLTLAGVAMRCEARGGGTPDTRDRDPADAARRPALSRFRPAWRLPALACAVAALVVLAPGANPVASGAGRVARLAAAALLPQADASPAPADVTGLPGPAPAAAASRAPGPPPAPSRQLSGLPAALQELQAELSARSLSGIQLAASGGTITASGRLDPRSEPEWRLAQQWFDGRYDRYGRAATLVDEVRFAAVPAAAVAVDAVWTGRNPNVVIKGQKYFEGAMLPSGFRLHRISPGELLVEREGQRQSLRY